MEVPGLAQVEGLGQAWQVALEAAPVAALAVPAGQGVGVVEKGGQKWPVGHSTGAPDAQKNEVGQGTQVSWRMRLEL